MINQCIKDSSESKLDSKLDLLNSRLDTRNFRVSRIKVRFESFEFRVTVNLHLTGTVCFVFVFLSMVCL